MKTDFIGKKTDFINKKMDFINRKMDFINKKLKIRIYAYMPPKGANVCWLKSKGVCFLKYIVL